MTKQIPDCDLLGGKKIIDRSVDAPGLYPLFNRVLERFLVEPIAIPKPMLKQYSSFNKVIETKYMLYNGGTISDAYLLFDVHLIDAMGDLLESYFNETNFSESSRRLSYRLIAEELYVKSKLHSALHFSYQYRATDGVFHFSSDRLKYIAPFTLVQEAFALCHELSHWCLFRCSEESKCQQISLKRQIWSDYFEELMQKRVKKCDAKGVALMSKMREAILHDDRIVEECACDTFATICLMEIWDGVNDLTKVDIAIASFLAIQFMQLLAFLGESIGQIADSVNDMENFFFNTTLRMLVFRQRIHSYFYTYSPELVDSFEDALSQCKDQYDRRIQDVFFEVLKQAKRELLHLNNLPSINFWDSDWDAVNNMIRSLLLD